MINSTFARNMSTLLSESEITSPNISVRLESAVISHNMNERGSIYVLENNWFPYWINIHKNRKLINFNTYTHFRAGTPEEKKMEIVNELNKAGALMSVYADNDSVCMLYFMHFRDGMLLEHFIRTCRDFPIDVKESIRSVDPDGSWLLPPGVPV